MKAELESRFRYHAPHGDQAERYTQIRAACRGLAELIDTKCPASDEKEQAFFSLDQVVFWANASIARHE